MYLARNLDVAVNFTARCSVLTVCCGSLPSSIALYCPYSIPCQFVLLLVKRAL